MTDIEEKAKAANAILERADRCFEAAFAQINHWAGNDPHIFLALAARLLADVEREYIGMGQMPERRLENVMRRLPPNFLATVIAAGMATGYAMAIVDQEG